MKPDDRAHLVLPAALGAVRVPGTLAGPGPGAAPLVGVVETPLVLALVEGLGRAPLEGWLS